MRSRYPGGNPGQTLVVLRAWIVVAFLAVALFARVAGLFRLGSVLGALEAAVVFAVGMSPS